MGTVTEASNATRTCKYITKASLQLEDKGKGHRNGNCIITRLYGKRILLPNNRPRALEIHAIKLNSVGAYTEKPLHVSDRHLTIPAHPLQLLGPW